jgi:hypothetical protein
LFVFATGLRELRLFIFVSAQKSMGARADQADAWQITHATHSLSQIALRQSGMFTHDGLSSRTFAPANGV